MLGVHPNTLRQWEARGIVHAVRLGLRKDRRYTTEEIERLLSAQHSSERGYAFHKGAREFKNVFENIATTLTKDDYYWAFAFDSEYASPDVRSVLRDLHESFEEKGVEDHVICKETAFKAIEKTFEGNENIAIHVTKSEVPTGVVVLNDRVLHLLWGEEPAIYEVLNAEVVRQYKNLFTGLWKKVPETQDILGHAER